MTQWVVIQSSAVRHISDTNTDPLIRGVNQSWLSHRHIVRKFLWFYTQFQGTAHSWANCQSDSKDLLGIVFFFFFLRSDPFAKVIMYFSSTVIPEWRRGIFLLFCGQSFCLCVLWQRQLDEAHTWKYSKCIKKTQSTCNSKLTMWEQPLSLTLFSDCSVSRCCGAIVALL